MNIEETYKKVKEEFLEYSKTTLSVKLGKNLIIYMNRLKK